MAKFNINSLKPVKIINWSTSMGMKVKQVASSIELTQKDQ
ncbi:MAG: hypothetical protein OHK0056_33370 [Bacteriovoracaceae bacterium]